MNSWEQGLDIDEGNIEESIISWKDDLPRKQRKIKVTKLKIKKQQKLDLPLLQNNPF